MVYLHSEIDPKLIRRTRVLCEEFGFEAFAQKPIELSQLLGWVQAARNRFETCTDRKEREVREEQRRREVEEQKQKILQQLALDEARKHQHNVQKMIEEWKKHHQGKKLGFGGTNG